MEHTNRTIRPLTQQDLEAYLDIYLNAYPAYKTLDEACREHYREKHRLELREDRQVQTVGLFEGDVLHCHHEADPLFHELLRPDADGLRSDGAGGTPPP